MKYEGHEVEIHSRVQDGVVEVHVDIVHLLILESMEVMLMMRHSIHMQVWL